MDIGAVNQVASGTDEYLDQLSMSAADQQVLLYLENAQREKTNRLKVYMQVNQYVKDNWKYFKGKQRWASQWGGIREQAFLAQNKTDLLQKLFEGEDAYLTHGVASEQWSGHRMNELKKFVYGLDEPIARETMINLAAEMAKKCKKEE